jgi:hypothetical protein
MYIPLSAYSDNSPKWYGITGVVLYVLFLGFIVTMLIIKLVGDLG